LNDGSLKHRKIQVASHKEGHDLGRGALRRHYSNYALGIAYLGWHSREGPDLSAFVVGAVPYLVANTLGLVDAPEDSFVHSVVFQLIVNMLLGAAIFFLGAFFWQTSKLEQKPD